MIKNINKIFTAISCFVLFAYCMTVSGKAESALSVKQVFPDDKVNELIREVDKLPVLSDYKDDMITNSLKALRATGKYPTRKGVILVTSDKYKDFIPLGHAAIIYSKDTVIEAEYPYVTFGNNDWNYTKGTCYGLSVIGTTSKQDAKVADWCCKQIGKSYNFNYLDTATREKFYCSQLVWAGFKDNCGVDLDTSDFFGAVHPMELVKSDHTYIIYEK